MKNLRNWAAVLALSIFVAGAAALEAQGTGWLSHFTNERSGEVQFRALSSYGRPVLIGFGTAVPTASNDGVPPMDGELYVVTAGSTEPDVQFWSANSSAWNSVAGLDIAQTFTASMTFGSDEDDLMTLNSPLSRPIHRDEFCNTHVIQNDDTAESGVDTEINLIYTENTQDGYYQFIEQTATLPLAVAGTTGCTLDVSGDVTANDGHEIKFTRTPLLGTHQVITSGTNFYFEISITIADISAFDGDWAAGLMLPEAQQNPPQHDGLDTYLLFTLSDNAGDLDVEADNGGSGAVNDDTSVTWADGETKVLRLEVNAAESKAAVDGTAITLTNSNLAASWFDTGDAVLPFYYHTQGAEGAASGVVINYVEWGVVQ